MTKGCWTWKENLLAFLLILSDIVSYNFDESDWDAVSYGLVGTSDEENIWFDYSLVGGMLVSIKLANDPEQELINYNMTFPDQLMEKLELAEHIGSNFMVIPRNFDTIN